MLNYMICNPTSTVMIRFTFWGSVYRF